jgi:hypothetical protein
MKKSIPTEQTPANVARVLALLAETPDRLADLSRGLSEEELRRPLAPGGRAFAEVLAHLINTESRTNESIVLAVALHEPLLANLHAEREYGRLLRHDRMPFADCLAYFRFRRAVLLRLLESLSDKQWARVIREEGKQRRESVYWRARGMALHELEHLAELGTRYEIRGDSGRPASEDAPAGA